MCLKYVQAIKEIEILLRKNKGSAIFPAKHTFSLRKKKPAQYPVSPCETAFVKNLPLFFLPLLFLTPEIQHILHNTLNNLPEWKQLVHISPLSFLLHEYRIFKKI